MPTIVGMVWFWPVLRARRIWLGLSLLTILGTGIWLGIDLRTFLAGPGTVEQIPRRILYVLIVNLVIDCIIPVRSSAALQQFLRISRPPGPTQCVGFPEQAALLRAARPFDVRATADPESATHIFRSVLMHSHTHQITMGLAFFLGAVHALEPGHGKTAMLVYLADKRRNMLHPLLMGISSAVSHSVSLIGIAFLVHAAHHALSGNADDASESAQFWLRAVSSSVVVCVGLWMLYSARSTTQTTHSCSCSHHRAESKCDGDSDSETPAGDASGDQNSGYSVSMLLGAAFGMLPCPSAVAAYLTGMAHGSPAEAYSQLPCLPAASPAP